MDLGLRDRVALVSGASSGLGLAIAQALAAEGAAVAMMARRAPLLEQEATSIVRSGGRAIAVPGDVRNTADVERVTRRTEEALGPVDILVANAGGPPPTTFADTEEAQYRDALELNLMGSIRLAQACVPGMRSRRRGRVIFLTSIAAKQPMPGLLLSNTARAGLLGFAKTLATECAPDNVLVNTVLPGHYDTARARELAEARAKKSGASVDELLAKRNAATPLGRAGRAEEMAWVVAFLASERASFLTGAVIPIDGGLSSTIF